MPLINEMEQCTSECTLSVPMVIIFNKYYMYLLTEGEVIIQCMYGICVKIFILGIGTMYISKSYTMTKNTIN